MSTKEVYMYINLSHCFIYRAFANNQTDVL